MTDKGNQEGQSQQLGLWDCISIIVGIVIGTTIFYSPGLILNFVPNPWMGVAVWLFGGFLAIMGGLCYAELATTYPRSGGDYAYLTQAYGPATGFLFGWAQLMVIMPASIGVMAFVFGEVATSMLDLSGTPLGQQVAVSSEFIYATGAVVLLTIMNVVGVTSGKITQNLLTMAKVIGLIGILVAGVIAGDTEATRWDNPTDVEWGWGALAIIFVLYAYGGWNDAAFVAAEVRTRERNIPYALLLGIGAITLIYVLVNLAYFIGLGFEPAKKGFDNLLPTQLMINAFGEHGGTAMRCIIMASALGAVNGLIFTGARIYATLGQDHKLFGFLGHWRPGKSAPVLSLLLQSAITIGLIFLFGTIQGHEAVNQTLESVRDSVNEVMAKINPDFSIRISFDRAWKPKSAFETLVSHSAPAFWIFFLLAGFSLFILRSKNPTRERPFSVPCYPLVPFIFCNMCVYMLYQSTVYIKERVVFVIALLLVGVPLYWLSRLIGGRAPDYNDPDDTTRRQRI
jgi:amino acid transporter